MPRHPDWIEDLYTHLANEEDARVCTAISEKACRETPGNFFRILLSNTLTKVGDRIANPKTTLAWLLQALGAPVFLTGIIVPLRESGSLLPQLLISGWVRRMPLRKGVWAAGSVVQGLAVLGMGIVAFRLEGAAAGWSVIALLALFSLARGFCSIAAKDVLGKTIPKGRRGRLKGWMSTASGVITVAAGTGLIYAGKAGPEAQSAAFFGAYLFVAGILWLVAAAVYSRVAEYRGETEGGGNALGEALRQLSLLKSDRAFRNFVLVRALAMGSALAAPFIITLAHRELGGRALWLGLFTVVDGLAAMVSGPLWGRLADRSSRSVLRRALLATGFLLAGIVTLRSFFPHAGAAWLFPLFIFLLGLIHNGVRLGRKTYLVDLAEGNRRTQYVAVSNTLIGILLLAGGIVSGLLATLSIPATLLLLAASAFTGFFLARTLPDVSADT